MEGEYHTAAFCLTTIFRQQSAALNAPAVTVGWRDCF